jgi:DNA-binding transcriptional LysR family regulator
MNNSVNNELYEKIRQKLNNRIIHTNFIKHIEIFESLYKTLSVRTTASELKISIGNVSNTLAKLEDIVGQPLFNRCGRSGLKARTIAIELHNISIKLKNLIDTMVDGMVFKDNNPHENKIIKIGAHPLFLSVYLNNITKSINLASNCFIHSFLNVLDREICLNALRNNEIDLGIFPTELRELNSIGNLFEIKQLKPYHLTLYINKENKLANVNRSLITWEDLNKLNIMTCNKNSRLTTAQLMLEEGPNKRYNFLTNSFDLSLLYSGLKNNLWSVAIGDEFEKLFDCKHLAIKRQDKKTTIQYSANWFAYTGKQIKKQIL